ncbi:MAG: hypothetical protein UX86_C0018G0011 [Candidatus Amesbacteria bacterium GW2011_GWC1_47_15]|uniref:Uncharacterized protein n=1 Tax=Candidatus Amesbacteria bacterium GW2011_GWC1_47_15 TaxID=1618364 RepID=A0A0G1V1C6_9BACT|nr:MAG: hypothetical protein UX86_C0018G0011 [Candidatus Amesbacteria bacterium GW2011_GWC1_47_15]
MPRLPRMRLPKIRIPNLLPLVLAAATLTVLSFFLYQYRQRSISLSVSWLTTQSELSQSRSHNENLQSRITELESENQRQKNIELSSTIDEIKKTYVKSVAVYEDLIDLKNPPPLKRNLLNFLKISLPKSKSSQRLPPRHPILLQLPQTTTLPVLVTAVKPSAQTPAVLSFP